MTSSSRIGFIQGRLSPLIDQKIQCFPWPYWEQEFFKAQKLGLCFMEWTLDQDRLYENPLMNEVGRKKIKKLIEKTKVSIPSLTGDCFMQAPFYKVKTNEQKKSLLKDLKNIIESCGDIGIKMIVLPLVDEGRLENKNQESVLMSELHKMIPLLKKNHVKIVFESDFVPGKLKTFINRFPKEYFGINYDIGNSASLGFNPMEEISCYGDRIDNVHVKDRLYKGTTVPLKTGHASFDLVFGRLKNISYDGLYILQTARSYTGKHTQTLEEYVQMTKKWLEE